MQNFLETFDIETLKYGNVKLTNKPLTLSYSDVITYVTKRVEALYTPLLTVLHFQCKIKLACTCTWARTVWCQKELISIVNHESFFFLFIEEERAVVVSHWSPFRAKVRHLKHLPLVDIYSSVIVDISRPSNFLLYGKWLKLWWPYPLALQAVRGDSYHKTL